MKFFHIYQLMASLQHSWGRPVISILTEKTNWDLEKLSHYFEVVQLRDGLDFKKGLDFMCILLLQMPVKTTEKPRGWSEGELEMGSVEIQIK